MFYTEKIDNANIVIFFLWWFFEKMIDSLWIFRISYKVTFPRWQNFVLRCTQHPHRGEITG
jgi:hypothetical protein